MGGEGVIGEHGELAFCALTDVVFHMKRAVEARERLEEERNGKGN